MLPAIPASKPRASSHEGIGTPPAFESADYRVVPEILEVLRERTGADFSRYRLATVYRRIRNRMICLGLDSLEAYRSLLQTRVDETPWLLDRLTIKVSRFYRNRATFDVLRNDVIPALARSRGARPIRVWSAGCGFGEEAYTLGMLLDEAGQPGIVHASDIDPMALDAARRGRYAVESTAELPADLAARYLEPLPGERRLPYRVRDELRERVEFSRHDVSADDGAPGPGSFDLVCCRNVLIYFERAVHEQALERLCLRVGTGGYLCLGEAEWPSSLIARNLEPLDKKTRVFRAVEPIAGAIA